MPERDEYTADHAITPVPNEVVPVESRTRPRISAMKSLRELAGKFLKREAAIESSRSKRISEIEQAVDTLAKHSQSEVTGIYPLDGEERQKVLGELRAYESGEHTAYDDFDMLAEKIVALEGGTHNFVDDKFIQDQSVPIVLSDTLWMQVERLPEFPEGKSVKIRVSDGEPGSYQGDTHDERLVLYADQKQKDAFMDTVYYSIKPDQGDSRFAGYITGDSISNTFLDYTDSYRGMGNYAQPVSEKQRAAAYHNLLRMYLKTQQ